jgi:hypothetical protein
MQEWLSIAREPAVVRRAIRIAMVVGTLLIVINHGDALLHGSLVPYSVSTVSSVSVLRELRRMPPGHSEKL